MQLPLPLVIIALSSLAALTIVTRAALSAWRDWLALQRSALQANASLSGFTPLAARIELADLRERVRKLEAIASGVDLLP